MIQEIIQKITSTAPSLLATYAIVYFLWGVVMHNFGIYTRIARFRYWWQIITCYIVYMVPISIALKGLPWYDQYAYGLFFMGILEIAGYTIKSSIAFDNNILDKIFGPRNFSLAMTIFFAAYFPIGNWGVAWIHAFIFG